MLLATKKPELSVDEYMHLLYRELKRMASGKMRRERDLITMGTTGLVHEAYLRMASAPELSELGQRQFTSIMAETMRRILIDRARKVLSDKRGNRSEHESLTDDIPTEHIALAEDVLLVDQVLEHLQVVDPVIGEVVMLRYFGGLTIAETASVLELSPRSVNRHWTEARAQIGSLLNISTVTASPI